MLPKFLKRWFSREPQDLEPAPAPVRDNVLRPGQMLADDFRSKSLCGSGYTPDHGHAVAQAKTNDRWDKIDLTAVDTSAIVPMSPVEGTLDIKADLQAAEARGVELDKEHAEVTARIDNKVSVLKQMLDSGALSRPSDKANVAAQDLKAFLDGVQDKDSLLEAEPWLPASIKDLVTDDQKSVYRSTRMRRTRTQTELGEAAAYALRVVAEVEKRKDATAVEIARVGQARYDEAVRLTATPLMSEAEQFEYDVQYSLLQLAGVHNEDAKFRATARVLWRRWNS